MSTNKPFNTLKLPVLDGPSFLYFNLNNAKLVATKTAAFSLPAGYTCPGACDCLAWFDRETNKLVDGDDALFRCFAASIEAAFPSVRKSVDRNLAILKNAKTTEAMTEIIDLSLPSRRFENIRIHADGDFFHQAYFLAWMETARRNPERLFYAYTKSLPMWVKLMNLIPDNFVLTASRGGKWDNLIERHNLRSCTVVYHPDEAEALGLEIDHDDSHARSTDGNDFALLLHGAQSKGSKASAALKRMRSDGVEYSYGKASAARQARKVQATK